MIADRSGWDGAILPFPGARVLDRVRDKARLVNTAEAAGIDSPGLLFHGPAGELRSARFWRPGGGEAGAAREQAEDGKARTRLGPPRERCSSPWPTTSRC